MEKSQEHQQNAETSDEKSDSVLSDQNATISEISDNQPAISTTDITPPEPPYSIYTHREKLAIVMTVALAALFSPLSANIYYPATNVLAKDLNSTPTLINLTVTSYLIFQGIAPTFIGSFADEYGRRPAYIICFTIYLCANIGLATQDSYAALFVLRCLQSSGSSGTVALASATAADIVTSAERGTYIGYAAMATMLGPSVGPIIGGLLTQYLGWRAIFWFLTIFGGTVFIFILLMLPETCRKIVGNGTFSPQRWNVSLLSYLKVRKARKQGNTGDARTRLSYKSRPSPLNSVRILFDKESGLVLLYAGLGFAGYYMVITGLPQSLERRYGFNTLQIGLCYIPLGIGNVCSSIIQGRFLNWNFRRHAKKLGIEIVANQQTDLTIFPIEAARLQVVLPLVFLGGACMIAYGWVITAHTSLAGPLILLFFATFSISGAFQGMSALNIDLNRSAPGTATAAMNLSRCLLGAGAVAAVIPLMDAIGIGWTSVLVACIWMGLCPIILVVQRNGPRWRKEKREKDAEKARIRSEEKGDVEAGEQVKK